MSSQQEIADILGDTELLEGKSIASKAIELALQEVSNVLSKTDDSLSAVCTRVENATTREELRKTFRQFNGIMRMFTENVLVRLTIIWFRRRYVLSHPQTVLRNRSQARLVWPMLFPATRC